MFGGDGLYAESKIALEVLFNKWFSESWAEYLTLAGAVIGWTRGTGLMAQNNVLAEGVEKLGCRTFSTVCCLGVFGNSSCPFFSKPIVA